MEHTPGPWRDEGVDAFGDRTIARKGNLAIAAVVSNLRSADEVAANARLISAAPELLEALSECLPLLEDWHEDDGRAFPVWRKTKAAIAKAEGRE